MTVLGSQLPDRMDLAAAAQQVFDLCEETNGATLNLYRGSLAGLKCYAVSTHPDRTMILEGRDITPEQLHAYIEANLDLLDRFENSVGVWYDDRLDETFYDVSTIIEDREVPIETALTHGELAVCYLFDLSIIDLNMDSG